MFASRSKRHRPEKLNIPFQSERRISPILSPESQVAARLEMISQEILNTYPDIFDEHISKVSLQDLTYEKFASTAKKLLEKYPGGWTRIALVCYFARELALEDESTDEQLEYLVEFSSKFISETSAEWIASQGGWVGSYFIISINLQISITNLQFLVTIPGVNPFPPRGSPLTSKIVWR